MDWGELLIFQRIWVSSWTTRGCTCPMSEESGHTLTSQEPLCAILHAKIWLYTWTSSKIPLHALLLLLFSPHDLQSLFLTQTAHWCIHTAGLLAQDLKIKGTHTSTECLQLCHENVTKHFRMAKMSCAQWQRNGSQCLTQSLCNIHWIYTVR